MVFSIVNDRKQPRNFGYIIQSFVLLSLIALPNVIGTSIKPGWRLRPWSQIHHGNDCQPSISQLGEPYLSKTKFALESMTPSLLQIRGGDEESDWEEDSDVEESDNDDMAGLFDSFGEDDSHHVDDDDDFAEDNMVDRFLQSYSKTPPLTKLYVTSSVLATLWGYLFHNNNFPQFLMLDWNKVLTRGQLWRPLTTFFNFGPFGLGYLMTVHFIWTYMSTLERLHFRKPYDFWIMILFGMFSMVVGYPILTLHAGFLGHNLSTFLVYVWSRYHEGLEVSMFELFKTRAELLPWFFLVQTFLLEGQPPVLDLLGIVFGHVYHHCKTVGLLRAPEPLVEWYEQSDAPQAKKLRALYKHISTDFEML